MERLNRRLDDYCAGALMISNMLLRSVFPLRKPASPKLLDLCWKPPNKLPSSWRVGECKKNRAHVSSGLNARPSAVFCEASNLTGTLVF